MARVAQTRLGQHDAVIAEVSGAAHYTGRYDFWFDPDDSPRAGFILPYASGAKSRN